jgi:hypothetical protein
LVRSGSTRFWRWPGEPIQASTTSCGVASLSTRFSAAVVAGARLDHGRERRVGELVLPGERLGALGARGPSTIRRRQGRQALLLPRGVGQRDELVGVGRGVVDANRLGTGTGRLGRAGGIGRGGDAWRRSPGGAGVSRAPAQRQRRKHGRSACSRCSLIPSPRPLDRSRARLTYTDGIAR